MALPIRLAGLSDRDACIDVVVRSMEGLDDGNEELLLSAFAEDIVYDLTGVSVIGRELGVISGRDELIPYVAQFHQSLDTLHHLTNIRVDVQGEEASLTSYVLAQHHRKGEGSQTDKEGLLNGNRLKASLSKDASGNWLIKKVVVTNGWARGDLSVFG